MHVLHIREKKTRNKKLKINFYFYRWYTAKHALVLFNKSTLSYFIEQSASSVCNRIKKKRALSANPEYEKKNVL